jgi:transcription-repair coupling factor (superfamily II helicase)
LTSNFASPFTPGELVVHSTHGVSRYAGTCVLESSDGTSSEYFQLDFAEGNRVYVPVEHVGRLSKHVGEAAVPAKLTADTQPRSPYSRIPKPK